VRITLSKPDKSIQGEHDLVAVGYQTVAREAEEPGKKKMTKEYI